MGMSTYVVGFRLIDEGYESMKAIYDACHAANIDPPPEVAEFFNYGPPSGYGAEIPLQGTEYQNDMQEGIDIDVADLPPGVRVIRFCNSY